MENWKHNILTEEELRKLVKDVYDTKIFTSLHLSEYDSHLITSIFMPIVFMGNPPSPPSEPQLRKGKDVREERKNKLNCIDETEQWKKEMEHYYNVIYPEWEKNEKPKIDKFMENIGMIYEKKSKAGPRFINGYPMFMSCHIVSKSDTKKFLEMYKEYEQKRKEFEEKW